jgi:hypothetical protein
MILDQIDLYITKNEIQIRVFLRLNEVELAILVNNLKAFIKPRNKHVGLLECKIQIVNKEIQQNC